MKFLTGNNLLYFLKLPLWSHASTNQKQISCSCNLNHIPITKIYHNNYTMVFLAGYSALYTTVFKEWITKTPQVCLSLRKIRLFCFENPVWSQNSSLINLFRVIAFCIKNCLVTQIKTNSFSSLNVSSRYDPRHFFSCYIAHRLLISQFKQEEDDLPFWFLNPNRSTLHHRYITPELHILFLGHDTSFYRTHSSVFKTLAA